MDKGFALKFISGKYQGGEFPLKSEKQVVIGRSSELDMVLVEDMVSRKHAKITFSSGRITIEDLGSTNGTFVNGEKVNQARLKEGDRILIGSSILKLIAQGDDSEELDEISVKQKLEEAAVAAARQNRSSSMTGKIEEVPLPDLLQLFHTSKKNGVLVVRNDQQGKIFLRQGRVYFAAIEDAPGLPPQKAFNRIITWERGDFELGPPDLQAFETEMDVSTEALLMDALRLMDEFQRLVPSLPATGSSLEVARPIRTPLKELSPEELDVFQLVLEQSTFRGVLDRAPTEDAVTAEQLLSLLRKNVVAAR